MSSVDHSTPGGLPSTSVQTLPRGTKTCSGWPAACTSYAALLGLAVPRCDDVDPCASQVSTHGTSRGEAPKPRPSPKKLNWTKRHEQQNFVCVRYQVPVILTSNFTARCSRGEAVAAPTRQAHRRPGRDGCRSRFHHWFTSSPVPMYWYRYPYCIRVPVQVYCQVVGTRTRTRLVT